MSERVALGTAQFGLRYGIANRSGQVPPDEAAAVVELARAHGVDTVDTAIAYGESESCLGRIGMSGWRIVSKVPPVPIDCVDVSAWVEQCLQESLARLGLPRLYGFLLHRPSQLLGREGPELYRRLVDIRRRGLVAKIGVSVYDPTELDLLLPRFAFDLVQAPFNVLDRRLADSGWLSRLHSTGVEVHVRSVFLQGLLLMPAGERPAWCRAWQPLWDSWHRWLEEQHASALDACLGFVLSHAEVGRVIVGVDGLAQLREILASCWRRVPLAPPSLGSTDPELINPSKWVTT
jgi:aryl-alcohol dehydrogenase-like predicted oxidoreductase